MLRLPWRHRRPVAPGAGEIDAAIADAKAATAEAREATAAVEALTEQIKENGRPL